MNVILIARLHQKLSDTVWKIKFKYLGDYRKLKKNRGDTDQSQLQSFANEKTDHTSDLIWHLHEKEQDSNQWNILTRCCGQCWDWQTCPELKNSASKTPSALENLSILVNKAAKKNCNNILQMHASYIQTMLSSNNKAVIKTEQKAVKISNYTQRSKCLHSKWGQLS